MGRTTGLLVGRKAKRHLPQLLGMGLLILVGVAFFVTLFTIVLRYEESAEDFFADFHYADVTLTGNFTKDDVASLAAVSGVTAVRGRVVKDFHLENDRILRAVTLTEGINELHYYEGTPPRGEAECLLLKRNADAMGIPLGAAVTLDGKTLTVTGIVASPEYVYMVQNERNVMAHAGSFGVVFVNGSFFPEGYNEIVALTDDKAAARTLAALVSATQSVLSGDAPNHTAYLSDLDQIRSFAVIFPTVFAALIAVVIFVMLRRTAAKERRQMGCMQALGMTEGRIVRLYMAQFGLAAVPAALLGCVTAMLLCNTIIGIFSSMFEVPGLHFMFYPLIWGGAILTSLLICALSGFVSLRGIMKLSPAQALRAPAPKGGRSVFWERLPFLWRRLSFNSRYAIKSTLRNKGRFFAVVLGMCGSCALMVFSLGFYDSIQDTEGQFFDSFARYDAYVTLDPVPMSVRHPLEDGLDSVERALMMPVEVEGKTYTLNVTQPEFSMMNLNPGALAEGVVIPEYYAMRWGVSAGDTLMVAGAEMTVSEVVVQTLGLALYTDYGYAQSVSAQFPPVYNVLFIRDGDMPALMERLQDSGLDYATIQDDQATADATMESLSVLIWFMIFCALILGFTVLYAVGLVNLSAREYEYMFMGVMGYSRRKILLAHGKESLLQLALALPLGFALGNIILFAIKDVFSNDSFALSTVVFPGSYLWSGFVVLGMTAVMAVVAMRYIGALDIAEGLKAQEET